MAKQNLEVVIDLGGQLLWFNCDGYNSSSYWSPAAQAGANPLRAPAATCHPGQGAPTTHVGPMPTILTRTCSIQTVLAKIKMTTLSTDGQFVLFNFDHPKFPFSCANSALLKGLASGTKGMIGLARTKTSLHKQLSLAFKLPHKFALCITSSSEEGLSDIFISGGPYYMPPAIGDFSKSLTSTPLIINPVSTVPVSSEGDLFDEYFIGVKSIRVDGKVVNFDNSLLTINKNGNGGTKLSTISPYTVLQSSIHKALVSAFVMAAKARKIKRVASVAPFGVCFRSTSNGNVPLVDLVLQSQSVRWKFYGENSTVKVKKDVMCLGFIDGD